jgi:hypothetical protein
MKKRKFSERIKKRGEEREAEKTTKKKPKYQELPL